MSAIFLVLAIVRLTNGQGIKEERRLYNGYQVLRTFPVLDDQVNLLRDLQKEVDTWTPVTTNNISIDLMISPSKVSLVKKLLSCGGISFTTTIHDLQAAINEENVEDEEEEVAQFKGTCSSISGMSWTKYHSYQTITDYMDCLASSYSSLASILNIGWSYENKPLKVMKVGIQGKQNKRAIWIDGGMHAQEWISPASVGYILKELVENSRSHEDLLSQYDFYIMPSANPDGYEYSRNYDRMWRKTRSRNPGSQCRGADPNRNWGYEWGGLGTSGEECSEIYTGPRAFSEKETRAIAKFILMKKSSLDLYLTFHSYGQMILYPWGYDVLDHNQEAELKRFGRLASRAMGRGYRVGNSAKVLYPAAGASDDWAYGVGIKYSYTIELPDTGVYGFILPASQIKMVGKSAFQATRVMVEDLIKQNIY